MPTPTATATVPPGATATAQPGATATATPHPGATPTPPPSGDVCTSGIVSEKTRLRAKTATGAITISGTAAIPQPWIGVAPPLNGIRLVIDGVLDVDVPGGAGWTSNRKGTRWRFSDPTGAHGGVRRIDLADRSAHGSGRLAFTIRVVGAPAMPLLGPLDLAIRFGAPGECATAHWNGPAAAKPRCQGGALRLTCN
jgi:hypothetical protein